LPLVDPSAGASVSRVVGLDDAFQGLETAVTDALSSSTPATVSDVVTSLNAIVTSLPSALRDLTISSAWGGSNGVLIVYLHLFQRGRDPTTCAEGPNCIH